MKLLKLPPNGTFESNIIESIKKYNNNKCDYYYIENYPNDTPIEEIMNMLGYTRIYRCMLKSLYVKRNQVKKENKL